jgi:hypothetical protein
MKRMRKMAMGVAVMAMVLASVGLRAQDAAKDAAPASPEHYYRLNLTVEEINDAGKVDNTRSYVATIVTGHGGGQQQIRTGSRIPIATGSHDGSTQFQYVDVGVNFDVHQVKEIGDKLSFTLTAEVSSLAQEEHAVAGSPVGDPVIRQNKWDSSVLIPVGKPTLVFSADDLDSKGKMQVELTATKVE